MEQKELYIESSLDGSKQPSLFYESESDEKRPLLVGLHTWSYDRYNQIKAMLPHAEKYDFHLLLPEFRGPNNYTNYNCTLACGSEYAKQDIKDAIDYVVAHYNVDSENIFLLGASGGGHMSLLMAGFCPEYFKAVGAFVPITDLERWLEQKPAYAEHILACCSNSVEEMRKRSPMSYLDDIAKANVKLFHGKYDSVVPMEHSMTFYNEMLKRHSKASVYLDIFDGSHEMDMEVAMYWLLSQYEKSDKTNVTG